MSGLSDWTTDLDRKERDGNQPRAKQPKALHFALMMLGGCILISLVIGVLLRQVPAPQPRNLPAQAHTAVPTTARPTVSNMVQYRADPSGHFFVDAVVNGTTIRFLVDTGASVVALNRDDARAAGISEGVLSFTENMSTANGEALAARATLRTVRLEQLEVLDVPAVVMDQPMAVSLLGMSFLSKLRAYSIRDGVLTLEW